GELGERVRQATALLRRRGVRAGDRVAVAMDRTPAAVVLHLATLALGAASVPLAPDAGSSLIETVTRLLRPVFWYGPEAGETLWQEIGSLPPDSALPPADPGAVALILTTSGPPRWTRSTVSPVSPRKTGRCSRCRCIIRSAWAACAVC